MRTSPLLLALATLNGCFLAGPVGGTGTGECVAESCNGSDDDCDGRTDEGFAFESDPDHCGTCNVVCVREVPNAAGGCERGACGFVCDEGFADCDGDQSTGCEARLNSPAACGGCGQTCEAATPLCLDGACTDQCPTERLECEGSCVDPSRDGAHCGGCGRACPSAPNASAGCREGVCALDCDDGFEDCNGRLDDGCEVDTRRDAAHCGACDNACPTGAGAAECADGACGATCSPGRADCDGAAGCEVDVATDPMNCGGCGVLCLDGPNARGECQGGECRLVCAIGTDDCDNLSANGCETTLASDVSHCGECGNACSAPVGGTAMCEAGECGLGACTAGLADCDDDGVCETALGTNDACSACGDVCSAFTQCTNGSCEATCQASCSGCGFGCCEAGSCAAGACALGVDSQGGCRRYLDCRGAASCSTDCRRTGCLTDCRGAATCNVMCEQATCEVDCRGSASCNVTCDSAACRVHCDDASCLTCSTGVKSCGGDLYACNGTPCSG